MGVIFTNDTRLVSLMTTVRTQHKVAIKCDGGHYACPPPKECCKQGCCFLISQAGFRPPVNASNNVFNPLFLGHWYFWLAVTATVAGILCACSLWKKHNQGHLCCGDSGRDERASEPDSNGSCYAPPQYSRCNSFHQAPPPYSEVTSKPDLYPLVISYTAEPVTKNNSTGYLMVQYFRNFIVRPAGTISATSTIDSLSSSFICNAANEANTIIPPAYSSMGSLEEEERSASNYSQTEARNLPSSASFASYAEDLNVQESSLSGASHHGLTPVHSPCLLRPLSVVSIRNNPCFETPQPPSKLVSSPVPNEPKMDKTDTKTPICDASFSSKKFKKHKLLKERSSESEAQEDDNYFSDLLNLSVCAPSSLASHVIVPPNINEMHFSVTDSMTGSDISSLANLGTPDSPPRATSPTMEMKEILDRIQQLPHQRSPTGAAAVAAVDLQARSNRNYFHKIKAKTLYMPLNETVVTVKPKNVFPRRWLSRSAPNTPSGNFMPNFPQSKTKITDGSPLLTEHEESEEDNSH